MMLTLWHSPIMHGALAGVLSMAVADFQAFRSWQRFQDALSYDWGLALFRWTQGAIIGAVTAAGFWSVS